MLHHDHKLLVHINKEYKQVHVLDSTSMFHGNLNLHTRHIYIHLQHTLEGGKTNVCNITEFQWDGCEEDLLLAHRKHSTTEINGSQDYKQYNNVHVVR